jgi:predicted secreted protein
MNRVSFQVESSRDVTNDWIQAVVGISDEDVDAARLADRINQTMSRALVTAKAAANVRVRSGGYTTQPVHENGKLRRWRASQELILESADAPAVTKLVGTLQADLQLRFVEFSISPERRRATEDELIAEALKSFQARAELIRANLGAKHYEIVHISINGDRGSPTRPVLMEARSMGAMAPAPPALEGGSSRLSVYVEGTIEFE